MVWPFFLVNKPYPPRPHEKKKTRLKQKPGPRVINVFTGLSHLLNTLCEGKRRSSCKRWYSDTQKQRGDPLRKVCTHGLGLNQIQLKNMLAAASTLPPAASRLCIACSRDRPISTNLAMSALGNWDSSVAGALPPLVGVSCDDCS